MTSVAAVCANLDRMGAFGLARRIAGKYGVSLADMLGDSHRPTSVAARHELWMVIQHTLGLSFPEVGAIFNRDHTTVIAGVRKCEVRLQSAYGEVGS